MEDMLLDGLDDPARSQRHHIGQAAAEIAENRSSLIGERWPDDGQAPENRIEAILEFVEEKPDAFRKLATDSLFVEKR